MTTLSTKTSRTEPGRTQGFVTRTFITLTLLAATITTAAATETKVGERYAAGYQMFELDDQSAPSDLNDSWDHNTLPSDDYPSDLYRGRDPSNGWQDRLPPIFQPLDEQYDPAQWEELPGTIPQIEEPVAEPTEAEKVQMRVSRRYAGGTVPQLIRTLSAQRAMSVYTEIQRLIDTRHLQPSTYAQRVQQALTNLLTAVRTSEFLTANRLNPSQSQVASFESAMMQLQSRRVQSASDANAVMNAAIQAAGQTLGLQATPVIIEFAFGAVESLDKYSAFEPEMQASQPSAALEDHVVGIGVEIKPHDQGALVVKPLRGGPAANAGLQANDIIVGINGQNLEGKFLDDIATMISGPAGSSLTLNVLRNGRQLQPIRLTRQRVTIYSVNDVRMLESGVGYIKLDQFAQNSTKEVDEALWNLHRQGMTSLVFDLRGNPGGLLTTAIELSDKFLPQGNIVSTRGRLQEDNMSQNAVYAQTWKVPLVVLVDGDSASASEIFAAAIQENGRGLIVGRKSYGKGTVQTHFPMQSLAGNLRLTTAKFYSPNGREMAGAGVTPDIVVNKMTGSVDSDLQAAVGAATSDRIRNLAQTPSVQQHQSARPVGLPG